MGKREKNKIFGATKRKKKVLADNLERARNVWRQKKAEIQQVQENSLNESIDLDIKEDNESIFSLTIDSSQDQSDTFSLAIDSSQDQSDTKTINKEFQEIDGRRIIDFKYFMNQLLLIEKHGEEFGCRLSSLKIVKEIQNGLISKFDLKCCMCGLLFELETCNEENSNLNVNTGAVSGSLMIGIGLSNLNELTACMELPTMPLSLYSSIHADVAEMWRITAEETVQEDAKKEIEAAKLLMGV